MDDRELVELLVLKRRQNLILYLLMLVLIRLMLLKS